MHAQTVMSVCPQALADLFFEALHSLGGLWRLILSIITNVSACQGCVQEDCAGNTTRVTTLTASTDTVKDRHPFYQSEFA